MAGLAPAINVFKLWRTSVAARALRRHDHI